MSDHTQPVTTRSTLLRIFLPAISGIAMMGCAAPGYSVKSQPDTSPPLPVTTVYFYPTSGQSAAQQDRDRYECYLWARKQSGFDPGQAQLTQHQRVEVTPTAPPGSDTATGAVTGAIVGSLISGHHDRGFGLVFGAITGAMLGAASDSARQQQAERIEQQYNADETRNYAGVEKQARDYQRAMTACLEGHGYAVR
jgi:Glycine zipper 2TM domain